MFILKKIVVRIFLKLIWLFSNFYKKHFTSAYCYGLNLTIFNTIIHGLGILNYESMRNSGEDNFLKLYFKAIGPAPVIFDIGACSGAYSKFCKELKPQANIYAFEPHPTSFGYLKDTIKNTDITAYNYGLGDKNEQTVIYDTEKYDGSQHASIYKEVLDDLHKYSDTKATKIELKALDEFIINNKISDIDLIKIDTEGNELAVLKGAEKTILANKIKCIQFEFNEMNTISKVFLRDFIKLLNNYDFYRLFSDGVIKINYNPLHFEIFAFQNIIAIRKDIKIPGIN